MDTGSLEKACVVLTGSNAADLRRGVERLPGRRGGIKAPDKILLPLGFREYMRLTDPKLHAEIAPILAGASSVLETDC